MQRGRTVIFILISIIVVIGLFSYHYLIKIYESTVETEPKNLYADNQSTVTISVIPLNSFGWKALFRSAPAEFEIIEGNDLIEILNVDKEMGKIVIKAKSETGKVVIHINSKYSLLPMIIEIMIEPNYT